MSGLEQPHRYEVVAERTSGRPAALPHPRPRGSATAKLDLAVLARKNCERYHEHYPDEDDRYGPAGRDWCRHDNQRLLSWAVGDVLGVTSLDEQACWLAGVLHSRGFPLDRLAHNLRMAADVVEATQESREAPWADRSGRRR